MDERPYELVLFGATGFTGRLVAEHLARSPEARDLRWALAGRDPGRLGALRDALAAHDPALAALPLEIVDAADAPALARLAARTRVIASTAGPFLRHGLPLVAACAAAGTSWCDITGESPFVRRTIDELDAVARKTGARVVSCCGFDSVPFDLPVHALAAEARRRGHPGIGDTSGYLGKVKGGFSGGTIATTLMLVELAQADRQVRRVLAHPHALDPTPGPSDPFEADPVGPRFEPALGLWTAPYVMSVINARIVRRSHAILGYGPAFRYREAMTLPPGRAAWVRGVTLSASLGLAGAAAAFAPTRRLLQRVVPAPGEGPDEAAREAGHYEVIVLARVGDPDGGETLRATLRGQGDPGYACTSRMLGQAALALARDPLPDRAGVLTPAAAMGDALLARLARVGMPLQVE